jgi:hypothetical protein
MSDVETKLKGLLYRLHCPSMLELGEYDLGLLDHYRSSEIAAHATGCPLCSAGLQQMRLFMAAPDVVPQPVVATSRASRLLEQLKIIVVDLLRPPEGVLLPAAPLPAMRGEGEGIATNVFYVDPYIISLSTIKDGAAWRRQSLVGDIIPADGASPSFQHWNVYLWRAGRLLATGKVDDDSHFLLRDVQVADELHDLILSGPHIEIHLENLRMS